MLICCARQKYTRWTVHVRRHDTWETFGLAWERLSGLTLSISGGREAAVRLHVVVSLSHAAVLS